MRVGADVDPALVDAGDLRASPDLDAEPLELRLRLLRELLGEAGRTRGPASTRITRAVRGSMRRKSRASVCRAISANAPAISTPVGPPPTTTNVSQLPHGLAVGLALGLLERDQDAPADLERVLEALQPRRERAHSSWPK